MRVRVFRVIFIDLHRFLLIILLLLWLGHKNRLELTKAFHGMLQIYLDANQNILNRIYNEFYKMNEIYFSALQFL